MTTELRSDKQGNGGVGDSSTVDPRDELGRVVREAEIKAFCEDYDCSISECASWENMDDKDKIYYRVIGEAVKNYLSKTHMMIDRDNIHIYNNPQANAAAFIQPFSNLELKRKGL
jgi:hypothetical protein